jgi:hypothetical protein
VAFLILVIRSTSLMSSSSSIPPLSVYLKWRGIEEKKLGVFRNSRKFIALLGSDGGKGDKSPAAVGQGAKRESPVRQQGFYPEGLILLYSMPLAVSGGPGQLRGPAASAHLTPGRSWPPLRFSRSAAGGSFPPFGKQQSILNVPHFGKFLGVEMGIPFRHALALVPRDGLHLGVRNAHSPEVRVQEVPP